MFGHFTTLCMKGLTKIKEKQQTLINAKVLKDTGIFMCENYCKDTLSVRKKLWGQVLNYRKYDKLAYLNHRSIVVRNKR